MFLSKMNEKYISEANKHTLKEDDILYFLHIPKTAGTTLITILDSHFDLDSILVDHGWNELLQKMPLDFSKIRLIRGHFGYGLYSLLPKKPVYITMLRNPVERTISDYYQTRRNQNPTPKGYLIRNTELSDVVKDPSKKQIFANNQVRHIALDLDIFSSTKEIDKDVLANFSYDSYAEFFLPGISNEKLLDTAKRHLSEFRFFGITERFEESLMLLCYTFGWRPIRNVIKQNVAIGKPSEFSKETIDSISECTKLDSELYRYAIKLFESRFSQMVKTLKEKYYESNFDKMPFKQMMHELLEKNYNAHFGESNRLLSSIDFNFKQALNGSGWYSREFLPDGNTFRWTGPQTTSTIDFPLSRDSDLIVQFRIILHLAPDILQSLNLKVNDTLIELKTLSHEEKTIFEGVIPKQALQTENNFTRFTFEVNRTINPQSVNPNSTDKRMLGVAFDLIKIT